MSDENFSKFVVGKVEFSTTTVVARPQTFQVVPSKPDPSVPLSAIRALVQQWREEAEAHRPYLQQPGFYHKAAIEYKQRCADELAALWPAPPEDQP